ncbi:MAG: hypothetical protein WC548_01145 [Candidatus Pacearchaeota archaeon]
MDCNQDWVESKAKERISQNFLKTVLELSGYKVMNFGVENHNQDIISQIKTNYAPETNKRLMSMPDYVVMDEETKETWLVEVKYRSFNDQFNMKDDVLAFKYGDIKDYLDFWRDATLILVFNVSPYCLCVDVNKINWNVHFKEKFKNTKGNFDELWNFSGLYELINKKFPKVTHENFRRTLNILGIKE